MTGPLTALNLAFVHIFSFKGRATRTEFWLVTLFFTVLGAVAVGADAMMITAITSSGDPAAVYALRPFDFYTTYYSLITAIPFTTLSVRRLHDAGFSGFFWLLNAVPFVGPLALLVMYCLPSSNRTSVHGTPKGPLASPTGKPLTVDVHKRAMQGYATLFDSNKPVTQEMQATRKAEIYDYYRSKVLKSASAS
ncbi:DUF805 domain-containing protein [Sulfitobacter sp.]|uniref:DUF805 domain-containing protein n=1 Tax=Sulfitobacter sp. TaxID=1903071 RepID=UPI0030016A94